MQRRPGTLRPLCSPPPAGGLAAPAWAPTRSPGGPRTSAWPRSHFAAGAYARRTVVQLLAVHTLYAPVVAKRIPGASVRRGARVTLVIAWRAWNWMVGTKPVLSLPRPRILAVIASVVLLVVFVAAVVVTRASGGAGPTFTAVDPRRRRQARSHRNPVDGGSHAAACVHAEWRQHGHRTVVVVVVGTRGSPDGRLWGGPTADEPTRSSP